MHGLFYSLDLFSFQQDDPDGVGCFVQYRVAFYVAGDSGHTGSMPARPFFSLTKSTYGYGS